MAFIFGIIDLDNKDIAPSCLHTLCNSVKWEVFTEQLSSAGPVALGFAHHPQRKPSAWIYRNELTTVLCDARIFNTDKLYTEFPFTNPAEAFSRAYLKWGVDAPAHVEGEYAAVIIDHREQSVCLFRDHIGARPLTYAVAGHSLIFASHEFGIAASGLVETTLNDLTFLCDIQGVGLDGKYQDSVFSNIRKVLPGHTVLCKGERISSHKYWFPENIRPNSQIRTLAEAVEGLRAVILEATRQRMGPVRTGAHLSGGLDSSGIAAIVARELEHPSLLQTYSWTPDHYEATIEKADEKELIDDFVAQTGVSMKYMKVAQDRLNMFGKHPEFVKMDIELSTMEEASRDGVAYLFSGWGGDEFASLSLRGALNYIVFNGRMRLFFKWMRSFGIKGTISRFREEVINAFLAPHKLTGMRRPAVFKHLKATIAAQERALVKSFSKGFIYGKGDRTGFMLRLLYNYHIPARMDSWSYYGEKYGIEYKYPLADKVVIEYFLSIPPRFTCHTRASRYLYREALKGILPEKIRTRPNKHEDIFQKYRLEKLGHHIASLQENPSLFDDFDGNKLYDTVKIKETLLATYEDIPDRLLQNLILSSFLRYKKLYMKYVSKGVSDLSV